MSLSRARILLPAVLAVFLAVASLEAGSLTYPALGNLELDEGTIELWFTPMAADLYPPADGDKYLAILSLFRIEGSQEFGCSCAWYRHRSQIGVKVSLNDREMKSGLVAILTDTPKNWKAGEAHQLAFTWKGGDMAVYADGKQIGGHRQMGRLRGATGPLSLVIGGEQDSQTRFIVHAVRVSSVARPGAELAGPPRADLATLLLDNFDTAPGKTATQAAVISGLAGETGARLKGTVRHVQAPSRGLALYKDK